jgi:hypothetical protein
MGKAALALFLALALLLQQQHSAAAQDITTAAVQAMGSLMRAPLAAREDVMAQGYRAVEGARNWGTLAKKLATPGMGQNSVQRDIVQHCKCQQTHAVRNDGKLKARC